jgi:chromosome segregation protein
MYLKRLELIGFKSFANKTTLEFPGGIAAVVGPNGSGKSNIIDGIRWLLGEREAKSMRGVRVEDLIFAGTPKRARVGLAQASITFDNTSNFFPVDFSEVTIRRRVERNGTSQFFLNDAEVRLKDIIDFFAKSRLGTKGFSIINQGDSDLFVRANSKERRSMLEEILGLKQYQLKKHDAELKLRATNINVEKVRALIEELMPHLRLLRRQANKWEKHGVLENELKELEDKYFSKKLKEIEKNEKEIEPKRIAIDNTINIKEKEFKALQAELQRVEALQPTEKRVSEAQSKMDDLYATRSELQKELGRVEAQIELTVHKVTGDHSGPELVKMLEEARESVQDIIAERDIEIVRELLERLFEKISMFLDEEEVSGKGKNENRDLEEVRNSIFKKLGEIDRNVAELRKSEQAESESIRNFHALFKKAFTAVEAKKDEIVVLTNEKNKILFDRERIVIRKDELTHQLQQISRTVEEFYNVSVEIPDDMNTLERNMLKLRGELAAIGEIDEGLLKEAKETEKRFEFLSTQLEDLEKAYRDLKNLVHDLDKKIHDGFSKALHDINDAFQKYFRMMFQGGSAKLQLVKIEDELHGEEIITAENGEVVAAGGVPDTDKKHSIDHGGIEIKLSLPGKRLGSLDMLSGGEKSLVSLAVLFALISVSPPPFLVLDEVDAALDENNTRRFADLIKDFSQKTQFLIVTHNRATMEVADILYGVTMDEDGASKLLSLKLE